MLKRVWPKLTKKTLDRVVPKPPSLINNGKTQEKKLKLWELGKTVCV